MKFDLHVHSTYSGDSLMSVEDIVKRVKELGFQGFALTDHNTTAGNKKAAKKAEKEGVVFIPGIEISTQEGHLLGIGVKKTIKAFIPAEEAVKKIHEQGGVAVAAHPYDFTRHGMGDHWKKIRVDGIEAINGKSFIGNRKAKKQKKISFTAGSDAHTVKEMGSAWTETKTKEVLEEIQQGKTKARGGTSFEAIKSRIYRRMKGVPILPKV